MLVVANRPDPAAALAHPSESSSFRRGRQQGIAGARDGAREGEGSAQGAAGRRAQTGRGHGPADRGEFGRRRICCAKAALLISAIAMSHILLILLIVACMSLNYVCQASRSRDALLPEPPSAHSSSSNSSGSVERGDSSRRDVSSLSHDEK